MVTTNLQVASFPGLPTHCPVFDRLQCKCKRSETGRWEGLGTRLSCRFVVNRVGSVPSFLNWIHSGFGFSCIIPRVCAIYVCRLKIHLATKIAMRVVAKCSETSLRECSLVSRPSYHPVFDRLQYAKTEGEVGGGGCILQNN